jgi:hypothetical protein
MAFYGGQAVELDSNGAALLFAFKGENTAPENAAFPDMATYLTEEAFGRFLRSRQHVHIDLAWKGHFHWAAKHDRESLRLVFRQIQPLLNARQQPLIDQDVYILDRAFRGCRTFEQTRPRGTDQAREIDADDVVSPGDTVKRGFPSRLPETFLEGQVYVGMIRWIE